MHQKFICGSCKNVMMETGGAPLIVNRWVKCRCGYETRFKDSKSTTEHRRIATILDDSSVRRQSILQHRPLLDRST